MPSSRELGTEGSERWPLADDERARSPARFSLLDELESTKTERAWDEERPPTGEVAESGEHEADEEADEAESEVLSGAEANGDGCCWG